MGAWIEIEKEMRQIADALGVAPFVGAWIEIMIKIKVNEFTFVAPFVGAWIEIFE